ncbi:hypothetical protein K2173_003833 [Erythroxylum novogranatense]|uniref:SUPPRESSOR OF ABI3-5 n=1 Tax=Erythroxylum novogranatense TaxID=1862640 RepID=A0AAV8SJK2_9ROSI|nr:hypothetical protein K2173_003833 [Erythroxylum novogranatense]
MDPGGRYGLQQGWDNNSALEGYDTVHDPNYRVGDLYDERRFSDQRYSRENFYPKNNFHRDIVEREYYPSSPAAVWSRSRQRSYEEEYPAHRESRRHERPYVDSCNDLDAFRDCETDSLQKRDGYRNNDNSHSSGLGRPSRFGERDCEDYGYNDYDYKRRSSCQSREASRERACDYGRYSYDSDHDKGSRRGDNWKRHGSRDRGHDSRGLSRERVQSSQRQYERSQSRGHDDRLRSRSPRGRSHSQNQCAYSYDDSHQERSEKCRDHEERHLRGSYSVAPSATVVVKGLSQKTTEEDLYQILAEWGPLRHVRVIKERNSGISRGFAFIDFPSVDAACAMMDRISDDGLLVDGRKLLFEYSSKPTGGSSGSFGQDNAIRSGHVKHRNMAVPSDWMCTICGCVNFARRTSCFQCNEPRMDDAPSGDIALSNSMPLGKKGFDSGPTHVLVVRGLDENAEEEILRYEFSKHAPIKDLRLVRDKFTHVSRGFAFVHFHSVEDATKALEVTNGMTLERNGQILRVAYAKSILSPGFGATGSSQSSSLAAAAIEAAAFAHQYDAYGWAPKEYNPDDNQSTNGHEKTASVHNDGSSKQSGFVWDEASGYYYDAASGFYYDGNTGLYYDGNSGIWYKFDNQTQQYIPCTDQNEDKASSKQTEQSKLSDGYNDRKVVISAPATTVTSVEKAASLPDAIQAAATAALAAEKKEKEKAKEIKLVNKKKMNNVLTIWKQRSHEGKATRVALDDNQLCGSVDDRPFPVRHLVKNKLKSDAVTTNDGALSSFGNGMTSSISQTVGLKAPVKSIPVSNSSGRALMGVIRGSSQGVVKSETAYLASSGGVPTSVASVIGSSKHADVPSSLTTFRTDASALGSYTPTVSSVTGKRRFSEVPQPSASIHKEQTQNTYRDRAAERRSLYGSSLSAGDDLLDCGYGDSNRDSAFKKCSLDSMPFPPGVGGGRGVGDASANVQSYEVITADKVIDESNLGNRMLRSMGWHEGLGLGKDGSGMTEPVQAQGTESRAGLGSQQKKVNPSLEVQSGDSYKTLLHKKALARFREMSETS